METRSDESDRGSATARFAEMYDRNFKRVFNYVLRRVGNIALAEDLTSDVFFKALKNASKLNHSGRDAAPWLYRVATNEVNSYMRKHREIPMDADLLVRLAGTEPAGSDTERLEQELAKERELLALREGMSRLRLEDQTVISLRFFEKLSYNDMSKVLNITEGALRVRLHRALKNLRTRMPAMEGR